MSITIGVDPGLSGAIALVDSYGVLVAVHDMPVLNKDVSPQLLRALFDNEIHTGDDLDDETYAPVVIEDVHSMPKQGVASSFKFGRSKGVVEGFFAGAGLPIRYVAPSKWKRDLGLTSDKGVCRQRALELWPHQTAAFARVKDDGRAEAALIAYWWITCGDKRGAAA